MREAAIVSILLICVGCGGSSAPANAGAASTANQATLTEQLLQNCVVNDLQELSGILEALQGFLDPNSTAPLPQFDILSGLLTGTFPWVIDLDEDGTTDLKGTLGLTDASGNAISTTQLGSLLGNLIGGNLTDLDVFFAGLPDGTTINLGFETTGLQQAGGDGSLAIKFDGGQISDVGGGASFDNGDCTFDVDFDDIGVGELFSDEGFGMASVGFDLDSAGNGISGSIDLDGTSIAVVTASLNNEPAQVFRIDLETGQIVE